MPDEIPLNQVGDSHSNQPYLLISPKAWCDQSLGIVAEDIEVISWEQQGLRPRVRVKILISDSNGNGLEL